MGCVCVSNECLSTADVKKSCRWGQIVILNVIINKHFNKDFETNVKDKLFIEEQRFKTPVISSSIMIIFIITI